MAVGRTSRRCWTLVRESGREPSADLNEQRIGLEGQPGQRDEEAPGAGIRWLEDVHSNDAKGEASLCSAGFSHRPDQWWAAPPPALAPAPPPPELTLPPPLAWAPPPLLAPPPLEKEPWLALPEEKLPWLEVAAPL